MRWLVFFVARSLDAVDRRFVVRRVDDQHVVAEVEFGRVFFDRAAAVVEFDVGLGGYFLGDASAVVRRVRPARRR